MGDPGCGVSPSMETRPTDLSLEDLLDHQDWLRRLSRHLVGESGADDLVQETWLAALRARSSSPSSRPRAWLATVARNTAINVGRGDRRRRRRESACAPGDDVPSTEELVSATSIQREIVRQVHRLDEPYRTTVLLRYFRGMRSREIAAHQGVAVGTVDSRLRRAIALLRGRMDESSGGREVWTMALAPLGRGSAKTGTVVAGGILMKGKWTLVAMALVLVGVVGGIWRSGDLPVAPREASKPSTVAAEAVDPDPRRDDARVGERTAVAGRSVEPVAPIRFESPPVTGRVVDVRGNPIRGAKVELRTDWHDPAAVVVRTDVEGRFSATPRSLGDVMVVADADPYVGHARLDVRPGADLEIVLMPGVKLTCRVVDATTRRAVAGAEVSLDHDRMYHATRSYLANAEGVVTLTSPRNVHDLRVTATGYHGWSTSPLSADLLGGEVEVALLPDRSRHAFVRVVDEHGEPIDDVRFLGQPASPEDGAFRVSLDAQGETRVAAPGFVEMTLRLDDGVATSPTDPRSVMLSRPVRVEGAVVDADGVGVPGVLVDARYDADREMRPVGGSVVRTFTGEGGRFQLEALLGGRPSSIAFYAPGCRVSSIELVPEGDVHRLDAVTIPSSRLRTVSGVVTDERGAPVDRAMVTVLGSGRMTRTDVDGRFDLPGRARTTLHVVADGFAPLTRSLDRRRSSTEDIRAVVELVLRRGATIAGVVLAEGGAPIPGAIVRAHLVETPGQHERSAWAHMRGELIIAQAGPDSRFRLDDLMEGVYRLSASYGDLLATDANGLADPIRASTGDVDVRLVVRRQRALIGRVVSAADARVLPRFSVSVSAGQDASATGTSYVNSNGTFCRLLGDHAYDLVVAAEGHAPQHLAELRLEPGEQREQTFLLEPAIDVVGRLLDTTGRPMPGVHLELHPVEEVLPLGAPHATCDADGRFALEAATGRYRVFAHVPAREGNSRYASGFALPVTPAIIELDGRAKRPRVDLVASSAMDAELVLSASVPPEIDEPRISLQPVADSRWLVTQGRSLDADTVAFSRLAAGEYELSATGRIGGSRVELRVEPSRVEVAESRTASVAISVSPSDE